MVFDERAICECARSYPRSRHQILWTFFSFGDDARNIHLLSTDWLTLKSCLTDRLFLIHFSCLPCHGWWNSLEIYVGCGWPCLWIFIAMSECVNSFFLRFLILFLLFVLLCCVSVVLYSQWVLENWFDALVVWLFLIANELGFSSCQYSERFKPIFIT